MGLLYYLKGQFFSRIGLLTRWIGKYFQGFLFLRIFSQAILLNSQGKRCFWKLQLAQIFKWKQAIVICFGVYFLHTDKLKALESGAIPHITCEYDEESRPHLVHVVDSATNELLGWIKISYEPCFSVVTSDGFFFSEEEKKMIRIPRALALMEYSPCVIQSDLYQVPGKILVKGGIGFINGIYTSLEEARSHATKISRYSGEIQVSYIHNATHSFFVDVSECLLGYLKMPTPPVLLLLKQWEEFVESHDEDAKFLQIAHSQGAIHVRNALLAASDKVRSRIIVLAIAPGAIIPSDLCYRAYNYVSRNDIVPYFDLVGNKHHKGELIILEPHPEAEKFDHYFDSPTFRKIIEETIQNYLEELGENG